MKKATVPDNPRIDQPFILHTSDGGITCPLTLALSRRGRGETEIPSFRICTPVNS